MGLFDKLFGRKKPAAPSTSEVARERLTLMLVHDRLKLTPDLLERIKEELLAVISKYVEIEESGVDVELTHTEHSDKLIARMPVRRQRLPFQRDVLEPGMGNPVAAAAALAAIHQPATAAVPSAETAPAIGDASPVAAPAAPAQEAAAPSSIPEESAPSAAEAAMLAAPEPAAIDAGSRAEAPTQEGSGPSAGASVAPGDAAEAAASAAPGGGAAPTETPAPAATPTRG